jgi:putative tryptophan/tyrosine transport system substrate-binding protein
MQRREFIAGVAGAAACPLAALAQQRERVRRVGVLSFAGVDNRAGRKLLQDEFQKLGWIEGRNLRLDYRFGAGDYERARGNAADLVKSAPDVIVTVYGADLRAVQQETKSIPIVFIGAGDAFESGEVKNVARPEGNITGFANSFGSFGGKWMQLLKEAAPNITRVAILVPPPQRSVGGAARASAEAAARSLGLEFVVIPVSEAAGMKSAVEAFAGDPNGGLLIIPGTLTAEQQPELIRLAERYHLPAITGSEFFTRDGGLMSYHADSFELVRGAIGYVDRVLRGAKVNELPVQFPTRFRLVVNLKAAKAIGLAIPELFLVRADEVIE